GLKSHKKEGEGAMKIALLILASGLILTSAARAQESKLADVTILKEAREKIRKETKVTREMLERDMRAISTAFPVLMEYHAKLSVEKDDTLALTALVWKRLRGVKVGVPVKGVLKS